MTITRDLTPEIVTVTASMATEWLQANSGNRRFRPVNMARLKQALEGGEARLTNDAIAFDEEGRLLNGQHRLQAIKETGIDMQLLVMRGLPATSREAIDIGARRMASDLLAMAGVSDPVTAAATYGWLYALRQLWSGRVTILKAGGARGSYHPSPTTIRNMSETEYIADSLVIGRRVKNSVVRLSTALVAALHHEMSKVNPNSARQFWEALAEGENLSSRSPILKLRNWLLTELTARRRATSTYQAAMIIKAWNQWREGVMTDLLIWRPAAGERFPDVQGMTKDALYTAKERRRQTEA